MDIDEARQFVLAHPKAAYKGNPGHVKFIAAMEAIEKYKRETVKAIMDRNIAVDNPRWGRMQR